MTFSARWADEPSGLVRITNTYGPVNTEIIEHAVHLRHFWHELGELLNAEKQEEAGND